MLDECGNQLPIFEERYCCSVLAIMIVKPVLFITLRHDTKFKIVNESG